MKHFLLGILFTAAALPALAQAPKGPPVETTADDVLWRYSTDTLGADTRFKDHLVKLQGKVDEVKGDLVVMDGDVRPGLVYARFLGGWQPPPGLLTKGQRLFVACKGMGQALGHPYFKDCVIVYD